MTLFTRMCGYNRILALGSSAGGLGEGGGGVKVSRGPIWEVPLRSSLNFSHYEEGCTYSAVVTATVLLTRIPDFLSGRTRCIKSAFSAWVAISKKPPRLLFSGVAPAALCPGNMLRCIYLPTCGGAMQAPRRPFLLWDAVASQALPNLLLILLAVNLLAFKIYEMHFVLLALVVFLPIPIRIFVVRAI